MKITLVRPPFYNLFGFKGTYPLNLGYLVSALELDRHSVSVVDGELFKLADRKSDITKFEKIERFFDPFLSFKQDMSYVEEVMINPKHGFWDDLTEKILDTEPDAIGISCYTTSMAATNNIIKNLRKNHKDIYIFLGGIHVSSQPLQTMQDLPEIDCVVIGEGEITVRELAESLDGGLKNIESIRGIAYRQSGNIHLNPPRVHIPNLDSIPFPKRLLNGNEYEGHTMITSRGCPFNCNFCASKIIWSRKVRYRSIQNVIEEIRYMKKMGIRRIRIADDTFTLKRQRILEWCDQVKKNNLNDIEYSIGSRADTMDEDLIKALKIANVDTISFGIESGSPRIQKIIDKNLNIKKAIDVIAAVNKAGIKSLSYLMVGHPTEKHEDVIMSLKIAKKLLRHNLSTIEFNVVCPYPGTPLWSMAIEKKGKDFFRISESYKMFHQVRPVVNLTEMTDTELTAALSKLFRLNTIRYLKTKVRKFFTMMLKDPIHVVNKANSLVKKLLQ